jgi:hypothetical protein
MLKARSDIVFVPTADPVWPAVSFVASFRNEVEVLVGNVHHVDATCIRGIRVEDLPRRVFGSQRLRFLLTARVSNWF